MNSMSELETESGRECWRWPTSWMRQNVLWVRRSAGLPLGRRRGSCAAGTTVSLMTPSVRACNPLQACDARLARLLGGGGERDDWQDWLLLADRFGLEQVVARCVQPVMKELVRCEGRLRDGWGAGGWPARQCSARCAS